MNRVSARAKASVLRRETTVYRIFDADDVLLYVGCTFNPGSRLATHRRTQPWWPQAERVTTVTFANRADGEIAEYLAIREEHPIHNRANSLRGFALRARLAESSTA